MTASLELVREYLKDVSAQWKTGQATEHSYRPALKALLEFSRADFIRRLRELGTLLRKSVEEVKQGIMTIAKARSAKPHMRVESLEKTVLPTLSLRKRCHFTPCSPPPSRKTFDELVEAFERLGFSHGDAESRARLKLSRE